jgi:hypothetical protein
MALKIQNVPSADDLRNTRADILLSTSGSGAAVGALIHASRQHYQQAARDADSEMADHWGCVIDILEDAKRRLEALK